MADPAIAAEELGKRFGDVTALDKVDLQLPAGSVLGVLDPNSAGTTTLVRLHSATTGRAAPTMFRIGPASDTEAALTPLLTRFARWSAARAALQTATLIVVAIAIAIRT